jgi:hypothetical protein
MKEMMISSDYQQIHDTKIYMYVLCRFLFFSTSSPWNVVWFLQVHIHVVTLHGDEMMALRDSGNCSATISLMYSMTNDRYDWYEMIDKIEMYVMMNDWYNR